MPPRTPRDTQFQVRLAELAVDCAPLVAYGALIPAVVLDVPAHGWVNLHFSLLPAWRGAAPVQRAVIAGDELAGATTARIEAGLVDTGPVYRHLTEAIGPRDTAGDLLWRLSVAGATLLVATLDAIEAGAARPVPQSSDGVSHAPRLEVEDARVRWGLPAQAVDRLIRGCTPAPGPWTTMPDGARLKLGPVQLRPDVVDLAPGGVRAGRDEVLVGTASHAVALGDVSPAGRRPMRAADWARGARLAPDAMLGSIQEVTA